MALLPTSCSALELNFDTSGAGIHCNELDEDFSGQEPIE